MKYGASLGGPLVRDRTFCFAKFEQRRLNQPGLVTTSPENVAAITKRLTEARLTGSACDDGSLPESRLYSAWSDENGATWSANAKLHESAGRTICQCCSPMAAFAGQLGSRLVILLA